MTSGQSSAGEPTRERVRATIGQVGGYWRPLAAVARLQEELGELVELLMSSLPHPDAGASPAPASDASPAPASDASPAPASDASPAPASDASPAPASDAEADPNDTRRASELADLWIITTALADQFLGAVAEPDSYTCRLLGGGTDQAWRGEAFSRDLLGGLVTAAGRIARIVNYYDGPKTPRTFDGWISLSDAVAEFHLALVDVAHAHDVDLAAAVGAKLDAIPTLDSGRFHAGEHDPSTAASLESFRTFRALHSARAGPDQRARLWGSPTWSSESFASSVQAVVADLTSFTKAAAWEPLDGYLVSGPMLTSIALLDDWLARLLVEISERDPVAAGAAPDLVDCVDGHGAPDLVDGVEGHGTLDLVDGMEGQGAPDLVDGVEGHGTLDLVDGMEGQGAPDLVGADRRFAFNGLRMSVAVFSRLHDASDPHHSLSGTHHSPAGTFALLQVEHAVDRRPAQ